MLRQQKEERGWELAAEKSATERFPRGVDFEDWGKWGIRGSAIVQRRERTEKSPVTKNSLESMQ